MILWGIVATFSTTIVWLGGIGGHMDDAVAKRQMPQGDTTLAQLRYLIEENKSMRQNLLSRVERMNEDARRISASIVPCICTTRVNTSSSFNHADLSIVITNVGFGYNAANSTFTAPVSGLTGNYYTFHMASNSAIVNATVGDRFWVEHSGESDSSAVYGQEVTTFSGYLIKEL
ncbi:hypothetical protein ACJMK2_015806 [Sinanodonta woodiana]|uniref:C1q domain-containing protein n=1 Tax=Sinanodonta woodiana TaxID=1069815 RepID=A0ABD3UVB8_SINWO